MSIKSEEMVLDNSGEIVLSGEVSVLSKFRNIIKSILERSGRGLSILERASTEIETHRGVIDNVLKTTKSPWKNDDIINGNLPEWDELKEFIANKKTPFLVLNIDLIRDKYFELRENFPQCDIFYAMKANPEKEVLNVLRKLGSNFDVASKEELDSVLKLGVSTDRVSFGNTIKKEADIDYAYKKGVRLFACDSIEDLGKLQRKAPGANIFFRLLVDGAKTADWPLSEKFGSSYEMTFQLIKRALENGQIPYGLSFHVGSQQKDVTAWDSAIGLCKKMFDDVKNELDHNLQLINLGGGFPAQYTDAVPRIEEYATHINNYIKKYFGDNQDLRILLEPGRSIVGDSGVIVSEVVMASRKYESGPKWVYLDVGKFHGLAETMTSPGETNECIKYPFYTDNENDAKEPCIVAGRTCDSMDILYQDSKIALPTGIKSGDKVYICSTGAYTTTYSSIGFNGFKPLDAYVFKKSTVNFALLNKAYSNFLSLF